VTARLHAGLRAPRRAAVVAGAAALGVAALSLSAGALAPAAARAAIAVFGIAAFAVLARRAPGAAAAPLAPLAVVARTSLSRDAGLAIVETGGRRLLVGHGEGGVRLVADLSGEREGAP
jgi:hypothetical protein